MSTFFLVALVQYFMGDCPSILHQSVLKVISHFLIPKEIPLCSSKVPQNNFAKTHAEWSVPKLQDFFWLKCKFPAWSKPKCQIFQESVYKKRSTNRSAILFSLPKAQFLRDILCRRKVVYNLGTIQKVVEWRQRKSFTLKSACFSWRFSNFRKPATLISKYLEHSTELVIVEM